MNYQLQIIKARRNSENGNNETIMWSFFISVIKMTETEEHQPPLSIDKDYHGLCENH